MSGLSERERRLLLDNPDLFLLRYFPHKFRPGPSEPPELKPFHLRLIDTATTQPRGLILYPAGHGKTTTVSTGLPIWGACRDPNIRIAIILKNENDADNIGQAIQAELLGNELLIRDFGPFDPLPEERKPWATKRMSIRARTRKAKEPTIALFGAGSRNALGHRTDWMICDDIVHDENAATPERREKLREWFNQGPATSGEFLHSRLTVVGTLFDPSDLYNDLIELDSYHVQREDAIVDEEEQITLWPERWPWLRLLERKLEMGTLDFNKRYRNIAVDKSRLAFREEWVKGGTLDGERFKGILDRGYKIGEFEPDWWRYSGFDPAIGVSKSRKFCAHLTLALGSCKEHESCFWVVDLERGQMTQPQQIDLIIEKHEEYDLFESVIEANVYQAGLKQMVDDKLAEQGKAYRIEPHYTDRRNKPDPEMGVLAMSKYVERGWFHIPWGDEHSRRVMQKLVDEMVMYPGKYTDTVMALWMAWRRARETRGRYQSSNYLTKVAPGWAKRTRRRTIANPYYAR